MKKEIDILGASAAALSMILESLKSFYQEGEISLRIIKNINNSLEYPFEAKGLNYEMLELEAVDKLASNLLLGVNKSENKKIVYNFFLEKYNISISNFINIIHPQTAIASSVNFGRGIHINPMVSIAAYTEIENFVSINRNASVGHHTRIEEFCTLHPGVNVAGHCNIGQGVVIGMGANVIDGKKIGQNSIIGAGALVTKDIPENVVAMGVPAKIIKHL